MDTGRWLNTLFIDSHPAIFTAVDNAATDPLNSLLNYGVLGIFALALVYVVRLLDTRNVKNYDQRLADKDAIIADKNATIAKQDTIISMFIQHGQQAVPALQRTAQVIEAQAKAPPAPATLEEVGQILPRLVDALERLENHAGDGGA